MTVCPTLRRQLELNESVLAQHNREFKRRRGNCAADLGASDSDDATESTFGFQSSSSAVSDNGEAHRAEVRPLAVLLDFDGTLVDTEVEAMEAAFWTLAPYFPSLTSASEAELEAACSSFALENAGKAFKHMIDACDSLRAAAGLASADETRARHQEPVALLAKVDSMRASLGLSSIIAMRESPARKPNLLMQLKDDIAVRQANAARPNPGATEALESLQRQGVPFAIATTGGRPRVEACVDTAGLRRFFPDSELIHSGASDFTPPRFKPDPAVYHRAVAGVSLQPADCIAVEDSASGVASAANAGVGLIVGYVGASHIAAEAKESHARSLLSGVKSANGRGADVVLSHFDDLVKLVTHFQDQSQYETEFNALGDSVSRESIPKPSGAVFWR